MPAGFAEDLVEETLDGQRCGEAILVEGSAAGEATGAVWALGDVVVWLVVEPVW